MKANRFNHAFIKLFMLITLFLTTSGFTTKFGLDTYEIHLNNKLILKQAVNQSLSSRVLQLGNAKQSDRLRISYTHCNTKGPGTSRSLILKDEKGSVVKKWIFANAAGRDMEITMKELLQLEKSHADHQLSFYYTAQELAKPEMLSTLNFK